MDLEKLYSEIRSATESYYENLRSVDDRVRNTTIELNEVMGKLDDPESYIKKEKQKQREKIIGKYENKVAESLNEFEKKTRQKVDKLKSKLDNDTDYQEKTYKATKAGQILSMMDNEKIPEYLQQIDDPVEREEYIKLSRVKLQGQPGLQKNLNKQIVNSLPAEEKKSREELAYNQALLDNKDFINDRAITAADKVINNDMADVIGIQAVDNFSHNLMDKNDGIKNRLDDYIAEQY